MSQVDMNIPNSAGSVFRANLNAAIEAILTQNSAATEPTTTYPNMWWYDTSTSLLKRRNNANDAWIVLGLEAADTDGTLAANSDSKVATQKATKTYVDGKTVAENRLSISDNTTANASTAAHGFLKKLSNVATEFMNGVGNWVAITIDALLPSQTGNSGKFLTTNGSAASWGSVVSGIPSLAVNGWLMVYADTSRSDTGSGSYEKVKEVTLTTGTGSFSVSFNLKSFNSGYTVRGRIYKNGVAVGTERSTNNNTTGVTYAETLTGLVAGDKIQIYAKDSGAISNFRIYGTHFTVDTD